MANEFRYEVDFDNVNRFIEFIGRYMSQMGTTNPAYPMAYGFITAAILEAKNKEELVEQFTDALNKAQDLSLEVYIAMRDIFRFMFEKELSEMALFLDSKMLQPAVRWRLECNG